MEEELREKGMSRYEEQLEAESTLSWPLLGVLAWAICAFYRLTKKVHTSTYIFSTLLFFN